MHRAIVEAWFPWLGCLLAATVALWLVMCAAGGRLDLAKLRRLHRCEAGSVQTLSFVLTLPMFIMLLMFIVQVAELMAGIAVVHYAAFAGARAAIVWVPALDSVSGEWANRVSEPTMIAQPDGKPDWKFELRDNSNHEYDNVCRKYLKISAAATMACVSISPSRSYFAGDDEVNPANEMVTSMAGLLSPTIQKKYASFDRVLRRKCNYAAANTRIDVKGIDRDLVDGPTYNPYPGYYKGIDPVSKLPLFVHWNPLEVGWKDPITVTVNHYFALLPGPGRFLATRLFPADGTTDRVSPVIVSPGDHPQFGFVNKNKYRTLLKAVPLTASVTLSNEGLKSVMPYVQPVD